MFTLYCNNVEQKKIPHGHLCCSTTTTHTRSHVFDIKINLTVTASTNVMCLKGRKISFHSLSLARFMKIINFLLLRFSGYKLCVNMYNALLWYMEQGREQGNYEKLLSAHSALFTTQRKQSERSEG